MTQYNSHVLSANLNLDTLLHISVSFKETIEDRVLVMNNNDFKCYKCKKKIDDGNLRPREKKTFVTFSAKKSYIDGRTFPLITQA